MDGEKRTIHKIIKKINENFTPFLFEFFFSLGILENGNYEFVMGKIVNRTKTIVLVICVEGLQSKHTKQRERPRKHDNNTTQPRKK